MPLAQSATSLQEANTSLTRRAERAEKELAREAARRQEAESKLRSATQQQQPALKRSASSQSSAGRAAYSQSPGVFSGRQSPASPKKRESGVRRGEGWGSRCCGGCGPRGGGWPRRAGRTPLGAALTCGMCFGSGAAAKLRPGDSGFAGSSFRRGQVVDDPEDGFDEDPTSD